MSGWGQLAGKNVRWGTASDPRHLIQRTSPLERAYVDTLLELLAREVTLERWAADSGSPSIAAACRPEWREDLCDRIERRLWP